VARGDCGTLGANLTAPQANLQLRREGRDCRASPTGARPPQNALNGQYQRLRYVRVLLSGSAAAMWNRLHGPEAA
jgi:hypothetical protein